MKELAEKSDNPFEGDSNDPFQKKKLKSKSEDRDSSPEKVPVDLNRAQIIQLSATRDDWKVELPNEAETMIFSGKVKTASLPAKTNFFEKLRRVAVNLHAKKAVVGFSHDQPKPTGTTRVVICDLQTGKTTTPAVTTGEMSPLALHDDGQQIVMRREEFGHGKQDRLEIWTLQGRDVVKNKVWTPHQEKWEANNSISWASFLGPDQLATTSTGGMLVIWSYPQLEPLYTLQLCNDSIPALSPDRKHLAFCNGEQVGLLNLATKEVEVLQPTASKLMAPHLVFSPSGKQFGCVASESVFIWLTETGEMIAEIPANNYPFLREAEFPADGYFLAGKGYLLDIANKLQFWQYEGYDQHVCAGGWTFFAVTNGDKSPGALVASQLPHTDS